MGSDESHFNVLLIVMDKVTSVQKPQLSRREESRSGIERGSSYQSNRRTSNAFNLLVVWQTAKAKL